MNNQNDNEVTIDKVYKDKMKVTIYNICPKIKKEKLNIERELFEIFVKYEKESNH